jgi:HSP20 family molecular chaperone IbpA
MSTELTERNKAPEQVAEQERWATPPVDVFENNDEYLLVADLPGVVADAVRLDVDQDQLTIEGRLPKTEGQLAYGYRRSFKLPGGTDNAAVNAELKQGVLWLHLPKAAAVKPRRIEIKAG